MSYALWLQILMEIALSVSREMDKNLLLLSVGKSFLKKLDGILFRVFMESDRKLDLVYSAPKHSKVATEIQEHVHHFQTIDALWACYDTAQGKLYTFKLKDYGVLVLLRSEQLEPLFINELLPIIEMFSTHLKASYTFEKQVEIEHFQSMLMHLALRFINVEASEVDLAVNEALEASGEFFNLDRAYVFEYDFEKAVMHNTHEWCSEGIEPAIELLKNVPNEPFEDVWIHYHKRGEILMVDNVEALDHQSPLYEILSEQGILSLITIPMMHQNACIGFVGFDSVKLYKSWSKHEIALLKVLAEMFTNLELKKKYEKQLVEAKKMAEAASHAKSNFLANMSHEIRTPLNGIVGMTYLLGDTTLTDTQSEYLKIISDSTDSLMGIINNILDFSKIESGQFKLNASSFDFEEELFGVCKMLNAKTSEKGVEWIIDYMEGTPRAFIGDQLRIKQILTNLMGNAVKFTHRGTIEIRVYYQEGVLTFYVKDTGIGISEKAQKEVFEQFTQEDDSSTKHYEGTGLGLAITKQLVELMNGSIELESEVGVGSIFTVKIPLAPSHSKKQIDATALKDKTALVVDDHPTNLKIMEGYLSAVSMKVTSVCSGLDAILEMEKSSEGFDYVLIDLMMPGMDGAMLGQVLCSKPEWRDSKRLLLSSAMLSEKEMHQYEDVFHVILSKPFPRERLIEALLSFDFEPANKSLNTLLQPEVEQSKRVLVVDDNDINRMMVNRLLTKANYNVDEADNGMMALQLTSVVLYDVILMDIQMPNMDGYEVTKMIRCEKGLNHRTPIIAISANAMEQDRQKSLAMGMNGHISKPFKLESLMEIETLMQPKEHLESFDRMAFDIQFQGDKSFGSDIIEIFKQDLSLFLTRIEEAILAEDFAKVDAISHELKGAAGYACAKAIGMTCEKLMKASRASDSNAVVMLFEDLKRYGDVYLKTAVI